MRPPVAPALITGYRGVVCDLDGVVYRGHRLVDHALPALLRCAASVPVVYATNNASRAPGEVAAQLQRLGLQVRAQDIVTSAQAGARFLAAELPAGTMVLAVGGTGVGAALVEVGLSPVAPDCWDGEVAAVLQGYGPDVTAAELASASYAIQQGARWVATNVDLTLPTDRGTAPGNGALVAAVRAATGADPVVVGKPERYLFDTSIARLSLPSEAILVIGDRLDTDITGAAAAGLDSLWVLTGVHGPRDLLGVGRAAAPTFIATDLRALAEPYQEPHREGEWWVLDGLRVRVASEAEPSPALDVMRDPAGGSTTQMRNAVLRAGVRALCAARDERSHPVGQLHRAATRITHEVVGSPSQPSGQ